MRPFLLTALVLSLVVSPVHAENNSPERVRMFAKLPNWNGIWETEWSKAFLSPSGRPVVGSEFDSLRRHVGLIGHPPYNSQWEAKYQLALRNPAALAAAAASAKDCTAGSFPLAMEGPQLFEFVATPEETLIVFDSGDARHVYTDGRSHPAKDDIWPTRMGDSVGHWQGDALIIDTIERIPGPIASGPTANLSEQAHFVEKIRQIDQNTMENQLTIDDPLRLVHPWQLTLHYSRVTNLTRMIPWGCENDREPVVNGKLTIVAP